MEAEYIVDSKKRCLEFGLKTDSIPFPKCRLNAFELSETQKKYSEVISVMGLLGKKTSELLEGIPIIIGLTDDQGYLLSFFGNETMRQTIVLMGIDLGIQMNEIDMGTNVIFLSLSEKRPIQLLGKNHFHEMLHNAACYSVPFYFANGLVGTVSIFTALDFHGTFALPLLSNMVDSMERELSLRKEAKHRDILHRFMINAINDGVIITDNNGLIIDLNRLIEKVTNCIKENVINKSVFILESIANYMRSVLNNRQRFENVECSFYPSPDIRVICLLDAFPILDDKEEIIGAYMQIRDITERIDLERQIMTAEKFSLIGELASGIAHEIRNPLTSVTGFIQLLKEKYATEETYFRYMGIVYDELISLKNIVSDFVLIAKPSSPEKKEYILQNIINETVQLMTSQANLKNIILNADLSLLEIKLFVDANQIKQVFMNLIQNAFEASPEGGEVCINLTVNPENDAIEINIRDTGIGITENQIKDIFNPFFTTKTNGLGLGLSICYRIIENHDGMIRVVSNQGIGTEFIIVLPAILTLSPEYESLLSPHMP